MKKTLFSILACCLSLGMAQAAMEDTDYDKITLTFDNLTPAVAEGAGLLAGTLEAGTLVGTTQEGATPTQLTQMIKTGADSVYVTSFLSPNINIGNTSGASWTYTCTFIAGNDFTIDSLSLAMATFSGTGKTQNGNESIIRKSKLAVTLTQTHVNGGNDDIIASYDATTQYICSRESEAEGTDPFVYNFDDTTTPIPQGSSGAIVGVGLIYNEEHTPIFIQAGDTVTLTVTAAHDPEYNDGHYVGLAAARFNVTVPEPSEPAIPEPATATLSLLALAALAARRRRK